ncbi:MAG: hypothetical protein IJV25_07095 [Prevotella sp.]|nr:hypothetical protein [Prevotella sp.]
MNATPTDGKQVTGWDITTESPLGNIAHIHIDGAAYSFPMPFDRHVNIHAVIGTTAIHTIPMEESQEMEYYRLDGRQLSQPQRGVNIIRMSDGKTKKVVR